MARTARSSAWHVGSAADQKVLLVLRHAKSDWQTGKQDHERLLNPRGLRDADAVGRLLLEQGVALDLVACSTAIRTRQTWECAAATGVQAGEVRFLDEIYLAEMDTLVGLVRALPEAASTVLLIGHNPGVADLVGCLGARTVSAAWAEVDQGYRTAGLAVLTLSGSWREAGQGQAALVAFEVARGPAPK